MHYSVNSCVSSKSFFSQNSIFKYLQCEPLFVLFNWITNTKVLPCWNFSTHFLRKILQKPFQNVWVAVNSNKCVDFNARVKLLVLGNVLTVSMARRRAVNTVDVVSVTVTMRWIPIVRERYTSQTLRNIATLKVGYQIVTLVVWSARLQHKIKANPITKKSHQNLCSTNQIDKLKYWVNLKKWVE